MKRAVWISLLAILAFAIILALRFPAQWAAHWLPPGLSCQQLSGTLWTGACRGLVAQGVQIDNASWDLHPTALVMGKLAGHVEIMRGTNSVRGDVEARSGNITARNLTADVPLDHAIIAQLPPNLSGHARANLALLQIEKGVVTAIQGEVEGRDLVSAENGSRVSIGSYVITFPAADPSKEPVGQLRSVGGVLDVQGTLRLTRAPGVVVEGTVVARPDAPPELVKQLAYLGSPDAQGRRPFSFENTF